MLYTVTAYRDQKQKEPIGILLRTALVASPGQLVKDFDLCSPGCEYWDLNKGESLQVSFKIQNDPAIGAGDVLNVNVDAKVN